MSVRDVTVCLVACQAALAAAQDPYARFIAQTDPLPPDQEQRLFHLPPGFEIELVAAEPAVPKPVNLAFDHRGRLLVSCSVEYPFPAPADRTGRDRIVLLTDRDGDGRFDHVQTFADGLNIPVGLTPAPNDGLIAYSIPNIWLFQDTDGDGRADRRRVLYTGFGHDDTHGMPNGFRWWLDGWVYACHGEGNRSEVAGRDGRTVTMDGAATFRFRPDGSRIECLTRGQVNPFGLYLDSLGDLFTADSHSRPAYLLLRGAWYPGLGMAHDGLGFGPAIMRHYHGSTGIAGIVRYEAGQFPAEYQGTLLIGNPATGRINHDRLEAHGSTYRAIALPDFLRCDDPWFRPVDLCLGPDGALYIADFYNRIIAHALVPLGHAKRDRRRGRIWRVIYVGEPAGRRRARRPLSDLADATAVELLERLRDPNPTVRTMATHALASRQPGAVVERIRNLLTGHCDRWQRVHGLWVLSRLGALDRPLARRLAADPAPVVRLHLLKALAERRNWSGPGDRYVRPLVLAGLSDPDPFVRRAAAEALGRHPAAANIEPLLQLWSLTPPQDTLLVHALRIGLRNSLQSSVDVAATAERISSGSAQAADRLADVCLGIASPSAAEFLLSYLGRAEPGADRLEPLLHHAARYLPADRLGLLYDYVRRFRGQPGPTQRIVLRALYRAAGERGQPPPADLAEWAAELARQLLNSDSEPQLFAGIQFVWDLGLKRLGGRLAKLAADRSADLSLRSFALDALAAVEPASAARLLQTVLEQATEPVELRQKAAQALGRINSPDTRAALDRQLAAAPVRLARTIARQLALTRPGAELLLKRVAAGQAPALLLQDPTVAQRLRDADPPGLLDQLAGLLEGLPGEEEQTERLIEQRRAGYRDASPNPQRGAAVFNKHCSACHQIGNQGTAAGPQLDGIGLRGLDRLLEDLLAPNRVVAEQYRSTLIALRDGRVLSGLVLHEQDGSLLLVDAQGQQVRVATADIERRRLSKLSPMPADVAEQLPEPDFYDLLSYLLAQGPPASK